MFHTVISFIKEEIAYIRDKNISTTYFKAACTDVKILLNSM